MNFLKTPTYRSKRWLQAVAELPCVICFREGATQALAQAGRIAIK